MTFQSWCFLLLFYFLYFLSYRLTFCPHQHLPLSHPSSQIILQDPWQVLKTSADIGTSKRLYTQWVLSKWLHMIPIHFEFTVCRFRMMSWIFCLFLILPVSIFVFIFINFVLTLMQFWDSHLLYFPSQQIFIHHLHAQSIISYIVWWDSKMKFRNKSCP